MGERVAKALQVLPGGREGRDGASVLLEGVPRQPGCVFGGLCIRGFEETGAVMTRLSRITDAVVVAVLPSLQIQFQSNGKGSFMQGRLGATSAATVNA
jgi:hypothetical protein